MIHSILIIASILFSTLGLQGVASNIDKNLISDKSANAVASPESYLALPQIKPRPKISPLVKNPNIYAESYILVDEESGVTLASKDEQERIPIASTTKVMTATIVLENYDLDDIVTISSDAANQVGADAYLRTGEEITVLNLLKCMLIKSANGAAYALAEHMNGASEEGTAKFVKKMNDKAKTLGMLNTEYHDPAGLDVTGWSSAEDLSIITKYAMKKDLFAEIVKTEKTTVKDVSGQIYHLLENSNRLVGEWKYSGALGVKTGYMPEAGHCLVGAAKRDGHTLISVVLHTNADTATASAEESKKLLDWGFENTVYE